MSHTLKILVPAAILAAASTLALAQDNGYTPYGNGPVVIVPNNGSVVPGYGYGGTGVLPYGNQQGVVVTPGGAVPYGRYNRGTAREAFRINNSISGAQSNNDAAARAQQPLQPLNPVPGNLR